MRAPSRLRRLALGLALGLAVGVALLPVSTKAATGVSAEDLVQYIESKWSMACQDTGQMWACATDQTQWKVTFEPKSGPMTMLRLQAVALPGEPMDAGSEAMMRDVLDAVCAPGDVGSYVVKVGALTSPGTSVPPETITGCDLNGGREPTSRFPEHHWISADVVAPPSPTPTPTPSPTPDPSPSPTPDPSPSPTPDPSPSPTPDPSPSPSPTPDPSPSPTATPSPTTAPSPSPTPSLTPTPSRTPGPAQSPTPTTPAAAASPRPAASGPLSSPTPQSAVPSAPRGTAGPGTGAVAGIQATPRPGTPAGSWAHSVSDAARISMDPTTAWLAALAVIALLFAMGFVGELFNNTLESNYDRIVAWWRHGPLGRLVRAVFGRGGA